VGGVSHHFGNTPLRCRNPAEAACEENGANNDRANELAQSLDAAPVAGAQANIFGAVLVVVQGLEVGRVGDPNAATIPQIQQAPEGWPVPVEVSARRMMAEA